jgi:hypothetical protein
VSDLICKPSIVPPVAATDEATIVNDGWFPDVEPGELRQQLRIRETVLPARLREAVLAAMIAIGNDLSAWQAARAAEGHVKLEAVPSPQLGGESRLVALYRRALGCLVKAELVERNRDFDQTAAGQRDASELDQSIGELRRDARHAIRDLLGRTRTTVDLI